MHYQFRKTEHTASKLKEYSELLSSVFTYTKKFSPDFLHWQYAQNPEGPVVGFDAYHNEKLVAHYVTLPVSYLINGKKTKGLLSLNTAVHPEHQGNKLFTQLAAMTFEHAKHLGYDFIIGVANKNSTYGFIKKLGFYLISPLEVNIGVGKVVFNKEHQYKINRNWTIDTYKWRISNPSKLYSIQENQLFACINKLGVYAQLSSLNNVLNANLELKKAFPIIKIWIGLAKRKRGFYLPIPSLLKPSPLNLVFKDLNDNLPILKSEDVLFELIDFDAY